MINSSERPKIKIPKTKSEWVWDVIGYSFYLGTLALLLFTWDELPQEIPAHYNALGEVDRWGSKGELLILPALGILIILIMQILERFPEAYNQPKRLNESNAKQFYLVGRKTVNQLKNICLLIFALVLFNDISKALGWTDGFGIIFFPIIIIGFGIPITIVIMKYKKIK